jgi:probable Rubsico expression protein CbbX
MTDTEDSSSRGFGMRASGRTSGGNSEDQEEQMEQEGLLSDDDTVDVGEEEASVQTKEVLDRLDRELVALEPVKTRIREIGDLLLVDRLRRRFGIASTRPSLHMSFTGSPGTGKTTVALRMAELLHRLGYLRKGHLVAVTRDDLVGQYIGHTAPKTKEVLKRAMGGVLFIDEAYYLYRQENERDYGQETIEILLQIMEQERENVVVILAGYKDRMDQFFQSNPGMGSRIAHHIHFPDYSLDELVAIAKLMLDEQHYELSEEAARAFRDYLARRMEQPRFANARSVRNALERSRLRQATRIVSAGGTLKKRDLLLIEADDILKSRVFSDTEHENPDNVRDPEAAGGG